MIGSERRESALQHIIELITQYGLWFVFFNVLIEQAGAPMPAYPVLIVTAALAVDAGLSVAPILLLAVLAALLADLAWYAAGRRIGPRVLKILCVLSLSPDSCVTMTRRQFAKWGPPVLLVAKFIPGFASVSTALAGDTRTPLPRFVLFDGFGALLWAGVAVTLGAIFHDAVNDILLTLEQLGKIGLLLIAIALAGFIAVKWWQRRRFLKEIRMARISVSELQTLLDEGGPIALLDVRGPASRAREGWISGSQHVVDVALLNPPEDSDVILYCNCPNDASAALVALQLKRRGFKRVRPLAGGLDAWLAAGLPVERL
jgi:membrane protein DedA with SNARE-associated domain/rhodanese-related sulfurtransferase